MLSTVFTKPSSKHVSTDRHLGIYTLVWIASLSIVTLEIVGSWLSGSQALLADIGHVASDTLLALVPLTAALLIQFKINRERVAFASSLVAVGLLVFVGFHVGSEAWSALTTGEHHEHEVNGMLLFIFSGLAAGMNLIQHHLLRKIAPEHHHGAHKGLHFHVLMDLVKNLVLPVLGLLIAFSILPESIDLWAALVIGGLLIVRAVFLLYTTLRGVNAHACHTH